MIQDNASGGIGKAMYGSSVIGARLYGVPDHIGLTCRQFRKGCAVRELCPKRITSYKMSLTDTGMQMIL